jgi:hypothetical protein
LKPVPNPEELIHTDLEPVCQNVLDLNIYKTFLLWAVLRIRDVYNPESEFVHPGSRVKKILDPGAASKNLCSFNPENCF